MEGLNGSLLSCACIPPFADSLHILLVDHDTTSGMKVGLMLETCKFKVTMTGLASVALTMIQNRGYRPFDLVMADVHMRDMDIFQFIGIVLAKNIPVILMSSRSNVEVALKCVDEGASFYYVKPISLDDLKCVWKHVFNKRTEKMRLSYSSQVSNGKGKEDLVFGEQSDDDIKFNETSCAVTSSQNGHSKQSEEIIMSGLINQQENARPYLKRKLYEVVSRNEGEISRKNLEQIESKSEAYRSEDGESDMFQVQISSTSEKKPRVVWTPDLHFKFTAAVSELGDKKSTPKQILRLMKVHNLNQRQVASHLQKFRAQVKELSKNITSVPVRESFSVGKNGYAEMLERNNFFFGQQSQRECNSMLPEVQAISYSERLKAAAFSINAQYPGQGLLPIQRRESMLGNFCSTYPIIADKWQTNITGQNKEVEVSASLSCQEDHELIVYEEIMKLLDQESSDSLSCPDDHESIVYEEIMKLLDQESSDEQGKLKIT